FFRDGIKGTFLFMGIDLGGSALLIYLFGLDNVSAFLIARGLVSTPIGIIWSQHIRKKQGYGREAQRNEAIKSFVFDLISVTVTYLGGGSNLGGLIIVYQLLRKIIGQAWSVIADLWYPKIVIKRDLTQDIYFLIPYNRKKFRSSGVTLKFGDEAERFGKDMVKASYYLQEKLKRGFGIRRLKSDDIDEMLNKAGVLLLNNGNWDTTNISDIIRLKTLLLEQLGAVEINTISEDNVREIIEPVRLQDAPREIVSFINCNLSLHNSIVNESKQYYRKLLAFSLLYAGKDSIDSQVWQKRLQAGQVKKEKILIWAVDRSILPGGIVSGLNGINVIVDRLAGGMIILTSAKDDPKTVFDLYCESLMGVQRLLYNSQVIGRLAGGDSRENFGADLIKHIESCHKPVSIDFYGWSTGEILEGIFARQVLKFITERLSRNPDSPKDLSALFNEFGTSPLLIDRIGLPLRKLCRLQFTEDVIKKADLLISAEKLIDRNIMNMHGELWGALFDWDQNEAFNNKEEMNHNRFMPPQSKPCLFVPKRSGIADGGFKEIENTEGINTVGIVSDTHDDKGSLSLAVRFFNENKVDLVLHAGDFTAAAMVVELNGLICQLRGVLGNSDTQQSAKLLSAAEENIWLGPGPLKILLSGKEICLIHDIKELNENDRQDSDVIISGHTHTAWMEESGGKLLINPGSDNWMHSGCFNSDPTVAILDLGSLKVDVYEISSKGKVSKKQMYSFGDDDYGFARAGTVTNGKPAGEAVIVALSLGGSKLGAGVLNLKGDFLFVADSLNLHEILGVKPKEAMPQNIVALIDRQIKNVVASSGIDPANIEKAGIAFAGPVNTRSGIIGTPFAAPNLPFDHFALQDVLQGMLRSDYGRDIPVVIENDCIAALRGELSPKGALHKIGTGTVFIIGTGINGAVAKDGKSYPGLQGEIMELGHNIVLTEKLPAAYTRSNGRYTYTGFVTKGDHPRDENGNIVKGDFEDRLSGPNLDARFVQEGFSLVGITDDALKGSAAAAELIESCGREIGQAVAAFIHAYIKEDFVRDIILISSVSENLGKGLKDSQGNDVFISAVQKGAGDELMKLGVGEQDAWGIVGGIMRSKMDYRRELVGFVNAGPVTEKEPGDPKNDFDELKNALAGLGDALDGGDLNKQGKGAVMYGRIIRGRCRGESFEVFSAGFARRMENNLNAALGILKTHKVREFVYCQGAAKSLDFMVSDDESSVFFDCSPGGLLRLPVSAFGNLNMLAFMLRHKLNCNRCIVDKNGNNDDFLRREAIRNDMKFFLRLNGRQRKDILLGLKRFPYPAEATLSDISQAVDNIDMSGLFRDIYGQDIHRFCQDEQRLVRDTKKIISFFESSSITDGRIIGFILGLVYINRMKSRVGISLRAYELQDLLTGLKRMAYWVNRIPHADMGVFVAKLDELLEEGIAGLAPAGKKSRIALISEVQNTIWRFNNRRLKEKYVKAMLGEISGLHKFIFVFGDTVYILDFQRAFSGKLETHRIFTSCRKGYKECDLRLGETILEFKFTLHFNDLYRQIVGLNKSISVFSLIQDARQAKNDLVPADAAVLGSIKNIVAFGEHAPANLISGIETYVRGHSRSADHRNSQPLRMRREFTEDGYTVRLTLEEFEDLLSSPPMLEGFINELEEFRRFQKKRRSYNDTPAVSAGDVLNVIRPIFADLKNAVPLERFDVYISISNPGVVIPASRDGGKHVNSKTRFVLPSIILESAIKSPRGLRIGVYPAYYRGLDETDLDILFNGKKVFDRIFIVAAGEAWDTDNSALQNRLNRIYLSVKHIPGVFAVGMAGRCFLPEAARKFGAQAVMRRLSRAPPVGGASSEVDMETDALYYKNYGLDTVYLFHTEETRSKPASRRSFFPLTLDGLINALAAAEKTANNAAPIIGSLMLGADTVLFPGSFDILTNGHIEIISRLGRIFNKVYVGVGNNPDKEYIFAANERVRLIQEAVKQKKLKNVKVYSYGGLTVDFAQSKGIMVMARGLRDNQDLIDEVRLASNNAKLNPDIQTIFLAGFEYPKVSSSKVKELAGDDSALSRLVPDNVKKEVQRKSRINDRGRYDGGNDIHDPADYGLDYEVGSVHLVDKRNNYIIGEAVVDWKNTEMTI
ncbi:MAG: pantetheine-phosphate adenylyltransferase, partial [Candidatus Omnitrophota bacterium]